MYCPVKDNPKKYNSLDICIVLLYNEAMELGSQEILEALKETALNTIWDSDIQILLVGGVAAMLTGQLSAERVTQDCDIMDYTPKKAQKAILDAANKVAKARGLPQNWLNSQAMQLNVLPDGFEWNGQQFKSLSAVARSVTGTRWNGYGFFGLLKK